MPPTAIEGPGLNIAARPVEQIIQPFTARGTWDTFLLVAGLAIASWIAYEFFFANRQAGVGAKAASPVFDSTEWFQDWQECVRGVAV